MHSNIKEWDLISQRNSEIFVFVPSLGGNLSPKREEKYRYNDLKVPKSQLSNSAFAYTDIMQCKLEKTIYQLSITS